jgi:hypothetical protein
MALVFRGRTFVLAAAILALGWVALSITFVTWGFVF